MFAFASTKSRDHWKKWFVRIAVGLVAVFAVVLLADFWAKLAPTYNGTSISRWIEISSGNREISGGLAEIGPKAIPYLIRAIERKDSPIKNGYVALWQKLPRSIQMKLDAHRPVSGKTARDNALWGLRFFGPEANAAVAPLIKLVHSAKDSWSHTLACHALAEVGRDSPEARSAFLEELKGGDPFRRSQAALAIWSAGWKFNEAVPLLIKDLANQQQKPLNQLLALGAIGPDAKDAVPLLIPLLNDQQLRGNTLTALKGIGPGAAAAVPALIEVLKSEPKATHPAAIEALINIGPAAAPALLVLEDKSLSRPRLPVHRQLRERLDDGWGAIRVLAAFAIGKIRGPPASALRTLVWELENQEQNWSGISWEFHVSDSHNIAGFGLGPRQTAAWFLGEIGPSAAEVVPALTKILQSSHGSLGNEWLRILAVRAIWRIDQKAEPVLPALRDALNSKDEFQCVMAAKILSEMGPLAKSLVAELLEARKVSLAIRREVNDALKRIDPEALIEASSNKIVR